MVWQELNKEVSLEAGQYILQTGGQVVTGEEVDAGSLVSCQIFYGSQ